MMKLADRIERLHESQTIAMARISRELREQGHDIISLSLGEPDFVTPAYIREAAKKAIDDGYTHYPPISGYMDLRQAICDKLKRENNLTYTPDQIVVSTGAKQCIANAVLCTINPGDEVIVPSPYWVSYSQIIQLAGGVPVFIPTDIASDFKITEKQLSNAITSKTRMFIFSSPCNPTGTVYTRDELKVLASVFEKHENIFILSDEIYEHINFIGKHESIAQFDSIRSRVIIVNGVSKSYAMTGWRIGYLAAEKFLAQACDKMQGQFTSAASSIAQRATIAAISRDDAENKIMFKAFERRRDLVLKLLKEIPGLKVNQPQGAFYVFPDVSAFFGKQYNGTVIHTPEDLCMFLLRDARVSLVTGEAFGDNQCIRISYAAADEDLVKAIGRISESLAKLN
ncbi:MAG: pyridoxal phosphate-dependent aminotransferase [Bacteroidia bacterium]|nr:pyridoxal phosphate-dependent aminotransferase [Bacteroidia bacterium]